MSERIPIIKFLMSANQYKRLWAKIKSKHVDEELLDLSAILMKDHSNMLKKLVDNDSNYPPIKIIWADDGSNWEEDYGKED